MNFINIHMELHNISTFFNLLLPITSNLPMQLLLMKRGGRVIYGGLLGVNSQNLIDYFQVTYV